MVIFWHKNCQIGKFLAQKTILYFFALNIFVKNYLRIFRKKKFFVKKDSMYNHRAGSHGGSSHHAHGGSVTSSMTSNSSHVMTCDLCSLTFPSLSVLNNHIKGSRHLRKVKSQQAYKQMKAAGMSIKQDSGEIRCEVCRVSVNSSHQLQAHLAGK